MRGLRFRGPWSLYASSRSCACSRIGASCARAHTHARARAHTHMTARAHDQVTRQAHIKFHAPKQIRSATSVSQAVLQHELAGPAYLSIRQLAEAIFGRPEIDTGGPTYFDVLPPILKCDTKSYEDLMKIFRHIRHHALAGSMIDILWGDGQTCIAAKNVKRKFPEHFARVVIGVAGFHEHAHFMFAVNEGWWDTLLKWCYTFLACAL